MNDPAPPGQRDREGSLSIDHFDEADGLAGNDSSAMAFLADSDGSLWLGASGGASHVLAQDYRGPLQPPRTAILRGRLGDVAVLGGAAGLAVPHDRGTLALELVSSTLLDARRVSYAMRLSPLETEWTLTRQREPRYPALQPGSYRFEVRARIGSGSWGPTTVLPFQILPAWWQTRWFAVLAVLAAVLAIGLMFLWGFRRRTKQLHASADASFRAVIDLMPDLISVIRGDKLNYVNAASRRFFGLEQPDRGWASVTLRARVHPEDRAISRELMAQVVVLAPQHATDIMELRVRAADGGWRSCEASAIRVELAGVMTVVLSARDVTERKRVRAKLLVSDRMASLGTLAAGIAHEINNPLAYVTGNLEAVSEILKATAEAGSDLVTERGELTTAISDARDGADRVRKIVHGLRLFSRAEEEKRIPLELPSVLDTAIRLTSNQVRHRAELVRELGAAPRVIADDGRLTQVFINLLVNAAHAIPEGNSNSNRIIVRTRADELGRAVAEIEDTGRGISPELLPRVFDPFFTTKDVGEGTGLGLSICHGIISSLGGQITIESAHERGTLVRVVLPPEPAAAVVPAAASEPAEVDSEDRRLQVLLVDDEPQVAHTMQRLLRRDYDVVVALCGRDAIDHISRGTQFDAIVSDVMMPNMTGLELFEELQRVAPRQADRMIFVSGGAFTADTRNRLDELGVTQLEKPISAKDLRAAIQEVVRADAGASTAA